MIGYGVIGLFLAGAIVVGGVRGGRGKVAFTGRFWATLVIGALALAVLWPLIALPILIVLRKLRQHGQALGDAASIQNFAATRGERIIDVEKK